MDWANLDNFNRFKNEQQDSDWHMLITVQKDDEGWIKPSQRDYKNTIRNHTNEQIRKVWGEKEYRPIERKFQSWGVVNHSRAISIAEYAPEAMKMTIANILADPKQTQKETDDFVSFVNDANRSIDMRLFNGVKGKITLEEALRMVNAGVLIIHIYYKKR